MIRPLYSVRDNVSGSFGAPFMDVNDDTAKRGFIFAIKNNPLQNTNAKDFDLMKIGSFDDVGGLVESCNAECILQGSTLMKVGEK